MRSAEENVACQLDQEPNGAHQGNSQGHELQVERELLPAALVGEPEYGLHRLQEVSESHPLNLDRALTAAYMS